VPERSLVLLRHIFSFIPRILVIRGLLFVIITDEFRVGISALHSLAFWQDSPGVK